ncbi:hypothetical protein Hdeb2414_s0005g00169451 [Helianthus debilis subsp. tardiflorus]
MFCLKLLACYLICSYLSLFDLLSIYVAYVLTLGMLYLLYYVLIHVYCPIHYVLFLICFIVRLNLFVYSFNILFTSCILLDYSKSVNTRIIQMRRIHQNRRETHNLVNDSQFIYSSFYTRYRH